MSRFVGLLIFSCLLPGIAHSHKPSDSFLDLRVSGAEVTVHWDLAIKDLSWVVDIDSNGDGNVMWKELKDAQTEISSYALGRLRISAGGSPCFPKMEQLLVDEHSDGAYAVLRFTATCPRAPDTLRLDYDLFFEQDAQHRGLLKLTVANGIQTAIFTESTRSQSLTLAAPAFWRQFVEFLYQGVIHIWKGFDHILFLLVLLLPAVLRREGKAWVGLETFREAFWNVAKIVTSFTAAHSITLALAALGYFRLPSRFVESAIAISVLLTALNNLRPFVRSKHWALAFGFGLLHGFGFASVLGDLGVEGSGLVSRLVAFNIGVEVGQLAIVALVLPLAFAVRNHGAYRRYALFGGSAAAAGLAALWFVERAAELSFMPF